MISPSLSLYCADNQIMDYLQNQNIIHINQMLKGTLLSLILHLILIQLINTKQSNNTEAHSSINFYLLQNKSTDGNQIFNLKIDNKENEDRGTIFALSFQGSIFVYYPDDIGNYHQQQVIETSEQIPTQIKAYQTQKQHIMIASYQSKNLTIYRQPKNNQQINQYNPTDVISFEKYVMKRVHFYHDTDGEYLIVCKIRKQVNVLFKQKDNENGFQLIQNITFDDPEGLLSCTVVDRIPSFEMPLLLLTNYNEIFLYELDSKKFKLRKETIMIPDDQNLTQKNYDTYSLFFLEVKVYEDFTLFFADDGFFLTIMDFKYEGKQFTGTIRQRILKEDSRYLPMIEKVELTDDGYLAILLSSNIIEIYRLNDSVKFEKIQQLGSPSENQKQRIYDIAFSSNHYQILAAHSTKKFSVYLSDDSPMHISITIVKVLISIGSIIVGILLIAVSVRSFLRWKNNKEQKKHRAYDVENPPTDLQQVSRQDLYGPQSMIQQSEQGDDSSKSGNEKSMVYNWREDDSDTSSDEGQKANI